VYPLANKWFKAKKWQPHTFQKNTWQAILQNKSGLLNAPTGCGKTFAIWFGILEHFYTAHKKQDKITSLHCLWITPLRALSKEIVAAMQTVSADLNLDYKIELRTGDTTPSQKAKQLKKTPQALVTTPESVHLLLATKNYTNLFKNLEFIVVDEWHELLGSKRGVQIELAISRLKAINPNLKIWGISATIGNLDEAKNILIPSLKNIITIKTNIKKEIIIKTILPDIVEKYSWAGHIGLKLIDKVIPIIQKSNSTLLFTNTRAQSEIWYQAILEKAPELSGQFALHHGSLDQITRKWVEDNLHKGKLKAVVATSSLDLGVDFAPVNIVIQIGSPKGIARLLQRAGRSGHQPNSISTLYFLPTNTLEIIEGAAIHYAIKHNFMEQRVPYVQSFDVLIQYLVTLAVSEGFKAQQIFTEIKGTHCFKSISADEFSWCLNFITNGGQSLGAYNEFHKVVIEDGIYKVIDRAIAMRHRLSIGTIVSASMMQVKYLSGKRLGVIEEWFISKLKPGDVFWFAGKNLEIHTIRQMEVLTRKSKGKNGVIPSWMGGRMPLSSQLSEGIRMQLNDVAAKTIQYKELEALAPLFQLQGIESLVPNSKQLLIETLETKDGHHLFIYPFEGRFVHEGMAAILAYRIGLLQPITFSIAMNDYGFELLSDTKIDIEHVLDANLFSNEYIYDDAVKSMNANEMAKRRFRDIASIAGLVFNGFPGKEKKTKHLQASSQLFFKVFEDYENDNLLLKQAYQEVMDFQLEIVRLQASFDRINTQIICIKTLTKPSPFCFPILVETLNREKFTNEDINARISKMLKSIEK